MGCVVAPAEASAGPARHSGAAVALSRCPRLRQGDRVFVASIKLLLAGVALRSGMTLGEVASMLGERLGGGARPGGSAATARAEGQ